MDEFVIDQTPPTLKFIMPDELKGISQIFQGDIAPQIEFGDINMTRGMASIELKGMKANSDVLKLLEDSFENYKGTVRYENLKKVRESDDIYTATAVVTDLAGNKVEKTITFSVNRFGSTYDYNKDDFTTKLMGYYFTNAPGDVILREVNVNQLTDHKLTLYKDGDNWVLVEGKDYKFEERQVNGHQDGDDRKEEKQDKVRGHEQIGGPVFPDFMPQGEFLDPGQTIRFNPAHVTPPLPALPSAGRIPCVCR